MISRNVSCRIFQARAEVEGGAPEMPFTGEPHAHTHTHQASVACPPPHQGLFMTSIRLPIGVKELS